MTPTRNCCMSLGMVLVLTASISRAEVRLETRSGDEPEVAVIVTPQGPWSPTSAVTSVVLNPDGDLTGDGQPGWKSRGAKALAAWARPTEGSIELAIGLDEHWTSLEDIEASGTYRQPIVDALPLTWTVTWQQDDDGRHSVWLASVSDDGHVGEPRYVSDGILVGTVPGLMSISVLVQHPETGVLEWIVVDISYVPTQPIPIELWPGGGIEVGSGGLRSLLGSCRECAELRFHDLQRDGAATTGLTWWTNASTLNAMEIGPRGPVLPVRVLTSRSTSVHPPRLVEDALRLLVRR